MRLIAGLDKANSGTVEFNEPARWEDVRVMFQEPRLLPWALVLSTIEVGLGAERATADARATADQDALADFEGRYIPVEKPHPADLDLTNGFPRELREI